MYVCVYNILPCALLLLHVMLSFPVHVSSLSLSLYLSLSRFVSCTLALSCSSSISRARACSRSSKHTHTLTHSRTLPQTQTRTLTLSHILTRTHKMYAYRLHAWFHVERDQTPGIYHLNAGLSEVIVTGLWCCKRWISSTLPRAAEGCNTKPCVLFTRHKMQRESAREQESRVHKYALFMHGSTHPANLRPSSTNI